MRRSGTNRGKGDRERKWTADPGGGPWQRNGSDHGRQRQSCQSAERTRLAHVLGRRVRCAVLMCSDDFRTLGRADDDLECAAISAGEFRHETCRNECFEQKRHEKRMAEPSPHATQP